MKPKRTRRTALLGALALLAGIALAIGLGLPSKEVAAGETVVVYKSPSCGCCKGWVKHLRQSGFTVEVHDRYDVTPVKNELGVPSSLRSCHTAKVGGYVIEGHVPAADIARLLKEKPAIAGLAAPGMPMGSPGMEGPRKDPYDVIAYGADGRTSVFATH